MASLNLRQLTGYIYVGIIVGFLSGIAVSIFQIVNNRYIHYRLYNLALFDIQHYVTKYVIILTLLSLLIIALILIIRPLYIKLSTRYAPINHILNNNIVLSDSLSLASFLILALFSWLYFDEIVSYLKSSPLSDFFGSFNIAKKDIFRIYLMLLAASGVIYLIITIHIVSKINLSKRVINSFYALINSRSTSIFAIILLGLLIIYNVSILSYKRSNLPTGPNIILISLDTVRADHLSSYGNPRNTSPNIDKLAGKGVLFENAYSQAPWTLPAMATVHTSLYPTEHGAIKGYLAIKKELNTLAEYMKNNNYKTMAITTHSLIDSNHGFAQGFDIFDERNHRGVYDSSSERITQKAIKLISGNKDSKFFLWVHYFDPHSAYIDHEEYSYGQKPRGNLPETLKDSTLNKRKDKLKPEDVQYVVDIYDEEISHTDKSIGELIGALDTQRLKEDTVIILTADHGEELLDRTRFGHGRNTYDELIHVPLIMYNPLEKELSGIRVEQSVETRDISKTIVEICGIPNRYFGGENLFDVVRDKGDTQTYFVFSEGSSISSKGTIKHAVIWGGWKLIRNLKEGTLELYDLENDPGEKNNLIDSKDPDTEVLKEKLTAGLSEFKKERLGELEKVKLSKEDIDELKALGYMQ